VRHFLATVTDASGSETPKGFEKAYTGLPVPDTDYYAFFCTWPAPEMPRPGCVWSHVLLLELTDLARVPDLSQLRHFCVRPQTAPSLSQYEQLVTLSSAETPSQPFRESAKTVLPLLQALYTNPESGIIALTEEPAAWEPAVFAVWSQQWPRLRRNFAFSTGSLGDRRLADVNFDLQIAPLTPATLWRRAGLPTIIVDSNVPPSPSALPWLQTACEDLKGDSARGLRRFLFTYGSDIEKPREAFAKLAAAYMHAFADPSDDWVSKLRAIGQIFPNQSEALRLKELLLKPARTPDQQKNLERAWGTASFLLDAPEASAYSNVSIDHSHWAKLLWEFKKDEVLSLLGRLVRQREKPTGTAFVAAIANTISPEDLQPISKNHPELVPILLSHRPALAKEACTWQLPDHTQWQVYDVLDRLSLDEKEWSEIEAAMFIAAAYVAVRESVAKAGQHAMEGALRWLNNKVSQEYLPSEAWRQALAAKAGKLLAEARRLQPDELALCAWLAHPDAARHLLSAERPDVQSLALQQLENIPSPLRSYTAFLLVTLGLRAVGPEGLSPLVRGFFAVHEALATISFSSESWQILSPELPRLVIWRDWDRCEKLRRAVRAWLHDHVKTGNPLLSAAVTPEQKEVALRVSNAPPDSDAFLD
jgi:hypothetical protein